MTTPLRDLISAARRDGWASGTATAHALKFQAYSMELRPVAGRRGQTEVETLRPVTAADAPKRSLSATFGTGAQPLHTDGAHLSQPPDIVILSASKPSSVPTMLSTTTYWKLAEGTRDDLAHGLFTVDDGISRSLAPAYADARFRFDPGCMTPADSRARRVVGFFVDALSSATRFDWSEPNQVLVINNSTVLHARADAQADSEREMQRLMFRFEKGTKW